MYFDMMNVPGFDLLDLSFLKGVTVGGAGASEIFLTKIQAQFGIPQVTVSDQL